MSNKPIIVAMTIIVALVLLSTSVSAASGPNPAIAPVSPVMDYGQSINLTASWSLIGATQIPVEWYTGTSTSCASDTTLVASYTVQGSSNVITVMPSGPGSYFYCVNVNGTNSSADKITVNPTLAAEEPTTISSVIILGQNVTLTANPKGGTTPYWNYTWYEVPESTCNRGIDVCGSPTQLSATSNTINVSPTTNTLYFYSVSDSAYQPATTPGSLWNIVTVNVNGIPVITPINSTVDAGQPINLTASWQGSRQSTYSVKWFVGSPATCPGSVILANSLVQGDTNNLTSITEIPGSYFFCVEVNGTYGSSDKVTVNPSLVANAPTPATATIDNGQSITLIATPTGGTTPYKTYQWYTSSGDNCASLTLISVTASGTYNAMPTSNTYYCYKVTDSARSPETATSSSPASVTVNPALSISISPSSPTIDNGQSTTLTATISGGTPPFSYQWYSNSACTTAIGNGISLTYTVAPSSTTTYCVKATDSKSSATNVTTVTVNPSLTASAAPTASNSIIDIGQSSTLTVTAPTTGTPPYTYLWYSGTSGNLHL